MGQVTISVNGRDYAIACGDGEEAHIADLAHYVDHHASGLAAKLGSLGETRLLLMTALTLADDLEGAQRDIAAIKREIAAMRSEQGAAQADSDALLGLARRLEDIAARLEST